MKNNILPIIILFSVLIFLFPSCSDWLDAEPEYTLQVKDAFDTPQELGAALAGVYHLVKGDDLAGRNWLFFSDLMAGDASFYAWDFQDFSNLALSAYNPRVEQLWAASYRAINQINLILASIDPVAQQYFDFSETQQQRMRGEALFLRAVIYFELLQYFALPDSEATADSMGVPIMLEPVLEKGALLYPSRDGIGQGYARVVSDLEQARNLLPLQAPPGKPGLYAASGYLARVFFHQGRYEEAGEMATEVVGGNFSLTETPQDFYRKNGSVEEIWAPAAGPNSINYAGLNWAYGGTGVEPDIIQTGYDALLSPQQQMALQEAGYAAIDLRGYAGEAFTDYPLLTENLTRSMKYQNTIDGAPLLRLAEILLIGAECAARQDDKEAAVELLNQIRRRAFRVVDTDGALVPDGHHWVEFSPDDFTAETLIEAIARERRVELAFEGNYLHDLVRRRQNVRPGVAWNDPRLRLPIPQREMDANPNLRQNPGY